MHTTESWVRCDWFSLYTSALARASRTSCGSPHIIIINYLFVKLFPRQPLAVKRTLEASKQKRSDTPIRSLSTTVLLSHTQTHLIHHYY